MNSCLVNLVKGDTSNTFVQLLRYVFVGGFAFVVDYGVLIFLTELVGLHYMISASVAFLLGLLVNYLLSVFWVFKSKALSNRYTEFVVFSVIGGVGLLLNLAMIYVLTECVDFYYMWSKVCSTGLVFFWNFFARKLILFSKR